MGWLEGEKEEEERVGEGREVKKIVATDTQKSVRMYFSVSIFNSVIWERSPVSTLFGWELSIFPHCHVRLITFLRKNELKHIWKS